MGTPTKNEIYYTTCREIMASPTSRTLAYLRKQGYIAQVVEKFNYFTKQRKDLFNVIDIVAVHPDYIGVLGVQVTSRAHIPERVQKVKEEPIMKFWLDAKNRLEVHGWGLMGKLGKRKKYEIKIVEIK